MGKPIPNLTIGPKKEKRSGFTNRSREGDRVFRTAHVLVKDVGHQTLTAAMTRETEDEEDHCNK